MSHILNSGYTSFGSWLSAMNGGSPNQKHIQFRNETSCITAAYEAHFKRFKPEKFKTENFREIEVSCTTEVKGKDIVRIYNNTAYVDLYFDESNYFQASNRKKKELALEILQAGVTKVAKQFYWELDPFIYAYEKIKEHDYRYVFTYGKRKHSPNRKFIAEIVCEHDIDFFDIYIMIRDKSGTKIKMEKVRSEENERILVLKPIGQIKWIANDSVILTNGFPGEEKEVKLQE